jgi:CHAT domain-containing protein
MLKKIFILSSVGILSAIFLMGQCPNKDSLWKRLIFLRTATDISSDEQLKELLRYEQAIKNCPYKEDTTNALLLQRIGVIYSDQSDYLKALHYISQSVKMNTPGNGRVFISIKELIRSYYNLYLIYSELGRATEKINAIDSCMAIALRTRSVDIYSLYLLKEKVEYLFNVGDYQRAIGSAEMGESIVGKYLQRNDSLDYIINFLMWKINALVFLKDYDVAEKNIDDKIRDCKSIHSEQYLGNLYEQLAMVLAHKKDYPKAEFYFHEAFRFHKKDKYDLGCGQTLTNLSSCLFYEQYKNYKKAISTCKSALQYVINDRIYSNQHSIELLNIFANIANAFVQQGLYDSAFYYFQRAFNQIKPGIDEEGILHSSLDEFRQFKKMTLIVSLLIDKADAYLRRFRETKNPMLVNEAIRIYKISDLLINRIKSEQSEVLSKLFWQTNTHLLYEHAIEACYLAKDLTQAFFFFEKSRAVLLTEQLNQQHWMNGEEILKIALTKKQIQQLEKELNSMESSAQKYAELQNEVFDRKIGLDHLVNIIRSKNHLYYQSFFDSTDITPHDVQNNLLKDHKALIEFFTGDSNVYCFVVTPHKIYLNRIDRVTFDSTTQLFNSLITNYDLLNRRFTEFVNTSSYLYKLIFQNNLIPPGRIIISPDSYYFPFEALVENNSSSYINYFVYDHAVSYTYSAKYLIGQFETTPNATFRNFLGVAPLYYSSYTRLAALPGSDQSLQQLKSYFSYADNFISKEASKNNFLQKFSKYKIIQLYTHAVSNSAAGEPAIYFADSVLYLSELINEGNPVTRLIILSACETAKGKFYEGEGIFNFNRGFAALGIPSSITNLWSVENESTYQLTELFYKYLLKDLPIDVALQSAKKEFIRTVSKEKKLPYFWASAILTGRTDKIEFKKTSSWSLSFLKAGLIVLVVLGVVYGMRRKKSR